MAEALKDDEESPANILPNFLRECNDKLSEMQTSLAEEMRKEGDAISLRSSTSSRPGKDVSVQVPTDHQRHERHLEQLAQIMKELGDSLPPEFQLGLDEPYNETYFAYLKRSLKRTVVGVMQPLVLLASKSRVLERPVSAMYSLITDMQRYVDKQLSIGLYPENSKRPRTQFITLVNTKESTCETLEPLLQEDENEVLKFRLKVPSGGLFKCKRTGLMFKMETAGELEYHWVPWGDTLQDQPWKPAGPLYNINRLQGTLVQLHLPHCEILSEGRHKFLRVVHITDGNLEIIKPKEMTETYVVVDTASLSLFGLITNYLRGGNIRAFVVLFFQPGSDPLLNALLLASNTDITVVKQKRAKLIHPRKEIYIDINPNCEINTYKSYTLSTDPPGLGVTPESASYVECGPNFTPTFTVYCGAEKKVTLMLKDETKMVWKRLVSIEELTTGQREEDTDTSVIEDFFQQHKATLKERLPTVLEPILNKLFEKKVLNNTEMDKIQNQGTSFNKNVFLVDIVDKKGTDAQAIFCQVLQKEDRYLYMDLAKQ